MEEGKPAASTSSASAAAAGGTQLALDLNKCITSGRKPEQRGGHSAVLAQGKLIVFGGHRYEKESRFRYFNDTYVLDLASLTWKEVLCHGDVIAPRYGHSATLVGTRMFVFGGKGQDGALYRDVNVLDLRTWTWAPLTSQSVGPSPRMGHASLLVGRKIVIHGGGDGMLTCNGELWIFDTETFSWLQPSVEGLSPSPRFGHSLALVGDGRILLFGGSTITPSKGSPEYLDDLRELDTENLKWTRTRTIGKGPSARYQHTATVLGGSQMIIFGGWGVGGMQCVEANPRPGAESLFIFDTDSSTWYVPRPPTSASKAPQSFHKYGHTVSVDPDLGLVVFGGWDGKQAVNDAAIFQVKSVQPPATAS